MQEKPETRKLLKIEDVVELSNNDSNDKSQILDLEHSTEILNTEQESIIDKAIKKNDDIEEVLKLFQINQAKKNLLRIAKYDNLIDKIGDEALNRISENPYDFSNNDLINYMKVTQDTINKSQETINNLQKQPLIQVNQQNNNIKIDPNSLDNLPKESREAIITTIDLILNNNKDIKDVNINKNIKDVNTNNKDIIDIDETKNKE